MPKQLEPKKSCATCCWSRFERTANGRIKRKTVGYCNYIVHWPPLPSGPRITISVMSRAIWPDFGTDCPVHDPIKVS